MNKLIRINQVMEMTGIAKSTVWLWVKEKKLPQPTHLSPRITVWRLSDIEKFIDDASRELSPIKLPDRATVFEKEDLDNFIDNTSRSVS